MATRVLRRTISAMGGPGSGRKRGNAKAAPRGAHWREARQRAFAAYGDTCHACGHPGAREVDHVIPMAPGTVSPADYLNPANHRPIHGTSCPCPVCGRACNQSKGGRRRANGNRHRAGPSAPEPERAPMTDAQTDAAMVALAPHHDGCRCRPVALLVTSRRIRAEKTGRASLGGDFSGRGAGVAKTGSKKRQPAGQRVTSVHGARRFDASSRAMSPGGQRLRPTPVMAPSRRGGQFHATARPGWLRDGLPVSPGTVILASWRRSRL